MTDIYFKYYRALMQDHFKQPHDKILPSKHVAVFLGLKPSSFNAIISGKMEPFNQGHIIETAHFYGWSLPSMMSKGKRLCNAVDDGNAINELINDLQKQIDFLRKMQNT